MTDWKRRGVLGLAAGALAWPVTGRAAPVAGITGAAFGTTWRLAAPDNAGAGALRPAFDALFAGIDREMSPWRADSDVSRLNAGGAGPHPVPPGLSRVIGAALDLSAESSGRFDPTLGPLVARWGFGPIEGEADPGPAALTFRPGEVTKARAGVTFDPCGIAKGHALDRAAELAEARGHESLLIDLGGELRAIGRHPDGRDWQVAVEEPLGRAGAAAVLRLPAGMSVATSGSAAQGYDLGGRRWSHIIDPATGEPATGRLRSVTVLSDSAMAADGWATALFAAGDAAGPDLARTRGLAALFLLDRPGGGLRTVTTGAMAEVLL
ncbi:FAD:protein FMN transferase [Rhodobacterales bacterium HKCCE2091]|nr:FAD:protein FMN transferase [Rhodobacterales bacterium HKCCE2091]